MKIDKGYRYTYVVDREACYASYFLNRVPSILISREAVTAAGYGAGVAWQFIVEEFAERSIGLRLNVFSDAWQAFVDFPELFETLCSVQPRTLKGLRAMLDTLGLIDATQRQEGKPVPIGLWCAEMPHQVRVTEEA